VCVCWPEQTIFSNTCTFCNRVVDNWELSICTLLMLALYSNTLKKHVTVELEPKKLLTIILNFY